MCVLNGWRKAPHTRLCLAVLSALFFALAGLVIECWVKLLRGRPRSAGQQHLRPALRALNQFPAAWEHLLVLPKTGALCQRSNTCRAQSAVARLSLQRLPVSSIHPCART